MDADSHRSDNITIASSAILDDMIDILSSIINGYLTTICVMTGIILNAFCMFIFLRRNNRTGCNGSGRCRSATPIIQYYLITLTLWQTALLANAFLLYSLPTLIYGRVIATGTYVYIYPCIYTLANMTHTGTVWIVLVLTIDRYLALVYPLKHLAIGKRGRVKRLMFAVSAMAIVFCLPRFFEVTVRCGDDEEDIISDATNCTPHIDRTSLPDDVVYWNIYHVVLAILFVTLIPCIVLSLLTLRISIALRLAGTRRRSMCAAADEALVDGRRAIAAAAGTKRSQKDHRANVMLVLVIAKFLASDLLPTVIDVVEQIVGGSVFMESNAATLLVNISNFLLVLNCSTNFWIYLIWGKRFRRSCYQVLFHSGRVSRLLQRHHISEQNNDSSQLTTTAPTVNHSTTYNKSRAAGLSVNGYGSSSNNATNSSKSRIISRRRTNQFTSIIPAPRRVPESPSIVVISNGRLTPTLDNNNQESSPNRYIKRYRRSSAPLYGCERTALITTNIAIK